jgi:hypothetical protein
VLLSVELYQSGGQSVDLGLVLGDLGESLYTYQHVGVMVMYILFLMWYYLRGTNRGYRGFQLLRFGYLGKWSPCVCESLNTKGEIFDPHHFILCYKVTLNL